MENMEYPEGATPLDPDEMLGLKHPHVTTRGQLDHLEQANIEQGLQWLSRRKSRDLLNEGFVRELHKKLFSEVWSWAGTFRSTEKNIGIDPAQVAVQLRILLDNVQYWVDNDTYEPLELAARLHHRLVEIHLFPNGNGRHARIMADVVLTNLLDTAPVDWSGGHSLQTMTERRKVYIQALREADQGNFDPLLKFVGATT